MNTDVNIERVEKWLEIGERIQMKIDKLHSPNDTPESSAENAFKQLYYNIATISQADLKNYRTFLNKRRGEVSDLKIKQNLGDFLSCTDILFPTTEKQKEVVTYLKKEGKLPFDDSEARRINEEKRRQREEEERRRREEEERRRREEERRRREEEERRRRAEEERRRREEEERRRRAEEERKREPYPPVNDAHFDHWLDEQTKNREDYIADALRKKKRKKKVRSTLILLLIIAMVGGGIYALSGKLPERKHSRTTTTEVVAYTPDGRPLPAYYRTRKTVNVRESASSSSKRTSQIPAGYTVTVDEIVDGTDGLQWAHVHGRNDKHGWACADYLEYEEPVPNEE